jgi:hypothetical protein
MAIYCVIFPPAGTHGIFRNTESRPAPEDTQQLGGHSRIFPQVKSHIQLTTTARTVHVANLTPTGSGVILPTLPTGEGFDRRGGVPARAQPGHVPRGGVAVLLQHQGDLQPDGRVGHFSLSWHFSPRYLLCVKTHLVDMDSRYGVPVTNPVTPGSECTPPTLRR